jgi:ribosomal-protein-serine acetyltransferase
LALKTATLRIAPEITVVPASLQHASALSALVQQNIPHLKPYLPKVTGLSNIALARTHLQDVMDASRLGELYEWHIFCRNDICGAVRLHQVEPDNRKASIAYYLGAQYQGAGLATTAVRAVIAHSFDRLALNRIELRCAADNLASQKIAKRLGFTWEGMLRQAEQLDGKFVDHFVYGLLREDARPVV